MSSGDFPFRSPMPFEPGISKAILKPHNKRWLLKFNVLTATPPFSAERMRREAGRSAWPIRTCVSEKLSTLVNLPSCGRSEEHTSELQSRFDLVCRLLLE